jgi:diacylglycerol O-acyltransferase / wax synthase
MNGATRRGSRRTMSGADAMWLHADRPTHLMVIDALMWTDEPLDWDRVRDVLQERMVDRYPVFRQRAVDPTWPWELPAWEDDPDFSVDRHVHRARLRRPGGDKQLRAFLEKRVSRPLDRSRPLWEAWFVDGYHGGSVVYTRLHHAMADGMALAQVMLALTDPPPAGADEPAPQELGGSAGGRSVQAASAAGGLTSQLNGAFGGAVGGAAWLARSALDVAKLPAMGLQTAGIAKKLLADRLPRTLLSGDPGRTKRLTWSRPRPVGEVRAMGRATGCTVNDVLVAGLSGGLARYLADHGQVVDHLTTMVPVNTRPPDQPLPEELGNKFALVMLHLPTGDLNPLDRLRDVHRRMDAIKHSPEALITAVMAEGIGHLHTVEAPFVDFFAGKAFGVTTNVMGPREPRYLAGRRIAGVLGWVPGSGSQTLGVCIYSYAGEVRIGFRADATVVPDPDRLVEAFDEELDALGVLVGVQGSGDEAVVLPLRSNG